MASRDALSLFNQHAAIDENIEAGNIAPQPIRDQFQKDLIGFEEVAVRLEEQVDDLLIVVAQCPEQDRGRQLAATVYAHV